MTATTTRADDRAAIAEMLAEMYAAWADNDADGFVKDYDDGAIAILPGSIRRGRESIRDSMAAGFDGPLKGSRTVDEQLSLRFVGEAAAVATCKSGILFAGESTVPEDREVYATWMFEKRDGQWWVAAYHNSPVQVPVQV